jgi:hypothetical protein
MRSVYLFKLLIHLAQYREVATAQVLELKYERVNEYFADSGNARVSRVQMGARQKWFLRFSSAASEMRAVR